MIGPLVSAADLAEMLSGSFSGPAAGPAAAAAPVLLDVRWRLGGPPGRDAYLAGHLPGAAFVDLDRDLAGPPGPGGVGGRHPLPQPGAFAAAMRRAGVRGDRPVVAYDDGEPGPAARAWWLLGYYGHPAVAVLDGGLRAWQEAGFAVRAGAEPAPAPPGDFTPRPGGRSVLDAAGAARVAARGVLLDARSEARYWGREEPVDPVAGHVPGAVSAPVAGSVDPHTGRLLPAVALRARFAALGVPPAGGGTVGAYCGSGVSAAAVVLALEVVGVPASLYVGSWSDWVSDPDRPVERG